MKKAIVAGVFILMSMAVAVAQGDRGTAELGLSGGKVAVEYGRPSLNKRDIEKMMNEQLPVGTPWRMGSGDATTLKTDVALKFGDKVIAKGNYTLMAKRVDEKNWVLIFNAEGSQPIEAPLTFKKAGDSAETMTITLSKQGKGELFVLHWGTFTLTTNFTKA